MKYSSKMGIWIMILLVLLTPIMAQNYVAARDYALNEALKLATVDSDFDYMITQVKEVKSMTEPEILRFIQRINEKRLSVAQGELNKAEKVGIVEKYGGGFVDNNRTMIYVILMMLILSGAGMKVNHKYKIKNKVEIWNSFRILKKIIKQIRININQKRDIIQTIDRIINKYQEAINEYHNTNTLFKRIGNFRNIELIVFLKEPDNIYNRKMSQWESDFRNLNILEEIKTLRLFFKNGNRINIVRNDLININKKERKLLLKLQKRLEIIDQWIQLQQDKGIDTNNEANKLNELIIELQEPII